MTKSCEGTHVAKRTEGAREHRGARQDYPQDRFDRIQPSGRVGAHRVTARPRYTWQYLIAGLLGFALLTTAGVIAVHSIGNTGKLPLTGRPSGGGSVTQTPDAVLNPDATVAVLNGTETQNLAAALDGIITESKWGKIIFSGSASASDVKISAVFYSDPAQASAAAGLAAKLGGLSTYTTEDYASYNADLIVLIGADYAGPGLDEAKAMTEQDAKNTDAEGEPSGADGENSDPETTPEIDPVTGWEIDPASGFPINPDTGLPQDPATIAP